MKKYQYILFDLDGTITESGPGITRSVAYALDHFGIHVEDTETLRPFVGPPLAESFSRHYGMSGADIEEAIRLYRVYYAERGMLECTVYDGVPEMLKTLREHGYKLYLATSKPEFYATQILAHFGLTGLLDGIYGAGMHDRSTKAEVITQCLETEHIAPADCVMVGDRFYDIEGARALGIDTIAVLYGYGTSEELSSHQPLTLVDTPSGVAAYLFGKEQA